jgi:SAM-dependent methyltransferase
MGKVAKIYQDGTYAAKNPTFGGDNAGWKVANALKACGKYRIPHKTILEVGCGGGAILKGVSQALGAEKAVGYEPMPEAFAVACQTADEKTTYFQKTIDSESNADFDLVLCFDVFEHIEDYFGFLRDLRRMGNHFLFHIPLDMNAQMVARGEPIQRVRQEVGHIHYFSKDTAIAALRECGYQIHGHFYTFGGDSNYGSICYRMMKLPRKIGFAFSPDATARIIGGYSLMVYCSNTIVDRPTASPQI